MNLDPDSSPPEPAPVPAPAQPTPVQPALVTPSSSVAAPLADAVSNVAPFSTASGSLRPPAAAATANPAITRPAQAPKFVSPMPSIEKVDDDVSIIFPIIAGLAAIVAIVFAVLLFLKN